MLRNTYNPITKPISKGPSSLLIKISNIRKRVTEVREAKDVKKANKARNKKKISDDDEPINVEEEKKEKVNKEEKNDKENVPVKMVRVNKNLKFSSN